jgi:acyl-CoA dehydrogenase
MVEFELDEEQTMLKEAVERFSVERVRKIHRDADEEGAIPEAIVKEGWSFGLLLNCIPERYGGFGEYSALTGTIALESMAFGDLAVTLQVNSPSLVAMPVLLAGSEAQQETFLPHFCGPEPPKLTAALTEPRLQFDPYNLSTTASLDGESYVLEGKKCLVPLANETETFLIYANEAGKTQAFLVPADTPGLEVGDREGLMGIRALPTYPVTLTGCRVPVASRLGEEAGIEFGLILNHSRAALGAMAVGMARAAYEYARDYAKERVQFGEPIAHRQSIAFMLAEMAIEVDAARLMVWETAWKIDRKEDATREATLMKTFVDDMVLRVSDRCVQTLGGYGYVREYPAELWLRNARGFATFDGLSVI